MTFPIRFSASIALQLLLSAAPAYAQDTTPVATDGTLHILRPMIHAEQDRAELCLETDHPLDDSDKARNAITLRLESSGKRIPTPQQGLNIAGTTLCLPGLDHRRNYRLTLSGLKGANSEKLTEAYHFSFTVPDRKPSLAFLSDLYSGGLMRWQNNDPVLHGMNVEHAKIELYRVDTLPLMVEAWRQHKQTTLAPSESAYFARDKGKLVWQGTLDLDSNPNKIVEQKVPLHESAPNLTPGFYLAVASAVLPKDQLGKNDLAPLAAAWLLRSNLKIHALRDSDGYYATAEKADASNVFPDIRILLEDGRQQSLAEGKTDADGRAHVTLSADKIGDATTLIGLSADGDVDFIDLTQTNAMRLTLPDIEASLQTDKDFYAPGEEAHVILTAQNSSGQNVPLEGTRLQIVRPDHSLFASLPVTKDKSGNAHVTVNVPVGNGLWNLQWQKNGGDNLAEQSLRITTNPEAPSLNMSADRTMLNNNGDLALTITGQTSAGKPAPFIAGSVRTSWVTPDTLFPEWSGYHFGNKDSVKSDALQTTAFLTDAKGQTQIHLNVLPSGDGTLRAASVSVESDPSSGAADPEPLIIPVQPADKIVGIRPLVDGGRFAENSLARFDIIALGNDGKRRDMEGLTYQIMEEGRSFDWYQDAGHWNYKPQQQTRRIGGGTFNIRAEGANRIDWPVNAGTYQLIIRDPSDKILAQMPFSAGWGLATGDSQKPLSLTLTSAKPELRAGEEAKIHYKLDQPAIVTLILANDHIRKIIHTTQATGDNDFSFTVDPSWRNRLVVSLQARAVGTEGSVTSWAGQITLPVQHGPAADASKTPSAGTSATESLAPLALTGAELPVLQTGDQIQFNVRLKNNTTLPGNYHYAFSALPGLKINGSGNGAIKLSAGQNQDVTVTLDAAEPGMRELKLEVTGPHNVHLRANWPLTVTNDAPDLQTLPQQEIAPRQSWTVTETSKKKDKANEKQSAATMDSKTVLFIGPEPLFTFPSLLTTRLHMHGFTTEEVAGEIELLRLWHDVILRADIMPEQKLLTRQNNLVVRLLSRQNKDGGFPPQPNSDADIVSTSSALRALSTSNNPLAKQATEQAAAWLHHRLDNSWFDERERPDRAAAYAALAGAGYTDPANLHYFSDTSADKSLPPVAAAQLALAFAKAKDQDKAIFWLNAIKGNKEGAAIAPELLPLLAENTFFDEHNLLASLGHKAEDKGSSLAGNTDFLRTMWFVQNRAGPWRATTSGGEQNLTNILVLPVNEKIETAAVRNPNDRPLYAVEARKVAPTRVPDTSILRHIYRSNGSEVMAGDDLNRGENYFVMVEGTWPQRDKKSGADDDNELAVREHAGPALTPVTCTLDVTVAVSDSLAWLKNLSFSPTTNCEKFGTTIEATVPHSSNGNKNWRIGYVAKAERAGSFTLNAPQIRLLEDATEPDETQNALVRRGAKTKVRIQQ